MQVTCHDLLLSSLTEFYNSHTEYKTILQDIVDGKHSISLRLIDWFVTHYSKTHSVCFWIDDKRYYTKFPEENYDDLENLKRLALYQDYRAQLKSYTKINFDSFRRHNRITFFLDLEKEIFIETTVGQLNFFRWVFKNKILDFISDNYNDIYQNMIDNNTRVKDSKNQIKKPSTQDITNTLCTLRFD